MGAKKMPEPEVRYVEVRGGNSMSGKQFIVFILIFCGVLLATQVVVPAVRPMKYEYQTYYLQASDDGRMYGSALQKLGKQGWELVEVIPANNSLHICYFKRPSLSGGSGNPDND